jgi:hypothetical protein
MQHTEDRISKIFLSRIDFHACYPMVLLNVGVPETYIPKVLHLGRIRVYLTRLCAGHTSNVWLLDLPLHGYYIQPAMRRTLGSVLPDVKDNLSIVTFMTGHLTIMICLKRIRIAQSDVVFRHSVDEALVLVLCI